MEKIKIELLEGGIMPRKEFAESAGYDLFVPKDTEIPIGRQVVPLGFRLALPKGKAALIFSRSGVACKGVLGFLSMSNGKLCNVKVMEGIVDEEKRRYLCETDNIYWVQEVKPIVNKANGELFYHLTYREKVFDPIRLDKCRVELGMVDCGYRGEVGMIIENRDVNFWIAAGSSIAQMVIIDVPDTELVITEKLDGGEGERGEQGFNS